MAANANAIIVVIDDRESGSSGEWSAFDAFPNWNTGNVQPSSIEDINAVSPMRGTRDIKVTGNTTTTGNSFFLYRQLNKAPGTLSAEPSPVYIGVRVKQQPYAWKIQWRSRVTGGGDWIFQSPELEIPAGTGHYDAIMPIPNGGEPETLWFAVHGSPTMGAEDAHQTWGFASIELKATLPNGTGPYAIQFDQMMFKDNSTALPVAISEFFIQ